MTEIAGYAPEAVALAATLTLLAGLATSIGGMIGVAARTPGPKFLAGALGCSAGVMLYVSFVEILPKAQEYLGEALGAKAGAWAAVGAFFLGIAIIAVIDFFVPEDINPHEPANATKPASGALLAQRSHLMKAGVMTAVALGLHNFPEGFATFVSGLEDLSVALPVVVAIAIHNIPEGVAVAVPIREATGSRRAGLRWATLSGLAEPAGALLGFLVLLPFMSPATMGVAFAAVAGVMVFISLDELLPTAEKTGEHHVAIYGLVAGMAVMALSLLLFI
ncbi:zinc transporter ZupT [Corynebacterium uterequi]|nr:zinc transporter ZupT [Corynebacterium uterequi]